MTFPPMRDVLAGMILFLIVMFLSFPESTGHGYRLVYDAFMIGWNRP